jgi:hypothetical protein
LRCFFERPQEILSQIRASWLCNPRTKPMILVDVGSMKQHLVVILRYIISLRWLLLLTCSSSNSVDCKV